MDVITEIPSGMFLMREIKSGSTIGPFRKDQLFIHGITAGTPVKANGMSDFEKAYLIPDLQVYFSKEDKAIAEGKKPKSAFAGGLSYTFEFLINCLTYIAKAVLFLIVIPFLPIYLVCKAISLNSKATLIMQILGTLFIICLVPISYLPYVVGFFILALIMYLICKALDSNDVVASLTIGGVLPIPNIPLIISNGIAAGIEPLLSRIHPDKDDSTSATLSTILFVIVSLVLLPIYAPAILLYQCARDRV